MKKDLSAHNSQDESSQTERFLKLLTASNSRIYAFILGMVYNRSNAEDIMQETTIFMWRKFSEFQPGTDFVKWGVTIAKYQVLGFWQKHRHDPIQFSEETLMALMAEADVMLNQVDARIDALQACLKKLQGRDRKLVNLHYMQDLAVKDVAEHIGRSIHTVYKSLARIHDMLLQCIRRQLMSEVGE